MRRMRKSTRKQDLAEMGAKEKKRKKVAEEAGIL